MRDLCDVQGRRKCIQTANPMTHEGTVFPSMKPIQAIGTFRLLAWVAWLIPCRLPEQIGKILMQTLMSRQKLSNIQPWYS